MTQTFMDTTYFQIIITITIASCIIGICAAIYNVIRYQQITKLSQAEFTESKHQIHLAEKIGLITGSLFLLALIGVVVILTMNLNKSNCLNLNRGSVKPEIGTSKDLAELFDQ